MAKAKVYFANVRATTPAQSLLNKIDLLFKSAGFDELIAPNDYVAVKLHFGEEGNTAFIRPIFVARIINAIKRAGGMPFLTDTNTLYRGTRSNAVEHLNTAVKHGFTPPVVDAPVIIADGLIGADAIDIEINQKHFSKVRIASAAYYANTLIGLAHVTGHLATGMGANIKNIGMGFGCKAGKQQMHSDIKPKINAKKCVACKQCVSHCPANAITIRSQKAVIDYNKCIGCADCTVICQNDAVIVNWDTPSAKLQEKMVEYAYAVLRDKMDKSGFFNFVLDVSPECDCPGWADAPIVNNIGIFASKNIVAVDQASADAVTKHRDAFREVHKVDWSIQLSYAEKLGLGTRDYELIEI